MIRPIYEIPTGSNFEKYSPSPSSRCRAVHALMYAFSPFCFYALQYSGWIWSIIFINFSILDKKL